MRPGLSYSNLIAAGIAISLTLLSITIAENSARKTENYYVDHYSGKPLHLKVVGSALDKAATKRADMMPIVGASEVYMRNSNFDTSHIFNNFPTGFTPFQITSNAITSVGMAEIFIGLGDKIKGKKIIVSYTPSTFEQSLDSRDYIHNFSRLHLYELVLSNKITFPTKQKLTTRLLRYRGVFASDPLITWSVQNLGKNTLGNNLLYYAAYPLLYMQAAILAAEDHWVTVQSINSLQQKGRAIRHVSSPIQWDVLLEKARIIQQQNTTADPYGIDNTIWTRSYRNFHSEVPGSKDKEYLAKLEHSEEWEDLKILLTVLKELGATPLILGRPIPGAFYEAQGISAEARSVFYKKLHEVTDPFGFKVIDFHEFEMDKLFGEDRYPHTGREGWVYVNRAMDDFFHDRLGK